MLTNLSQGYLTAPLAFVTVRALVLMFIGYSAYRLLLTGGRVAGLRAMGTGDGRPPWRYAGVMLIVLTPILILGIAWSAPGSGIGPGNLGQIVLGLVMVVAYASIYVLLGTALPEVVERGDVVFADAFQRGRNHYREIAMSMLVGVWLFRAGSASLLVGAGLLGFPLDLFTPDTGAFQPIALVPMLLFTASHVFAEVLTAVVMVRAYRRYPATRRDAVAA
jgi:hypothetical protein